jgi:integrase
MLYDAKPADARFLLKIVPHLGDKKVRDIKPKTVRDLGRVIYPDAATDTWRRQVVVPVSAVINNAHELGRCQPIRVRAYSADERIAQDRQRGKLSRQKKTPGSWEWLNAFRTTAPDRIYALALFMFTTGARLGQAIAMEAKTHLDLRNARALVPAAKGHDAQWVDLMPEAVVAIANTDLRYGRVFGYTSKQGIYPPWRAACKEAGIDYIPPHSAGRHGFGTELVVRQGIDPATAAKFGRWSSPRVMLDTYAHAAQSSSSVHDAFARGKLGKSAKPEHGVSKKSSKTLKT